MTISLIKTSSLHSGRQRAAQEGEESSTGPKKSTGLERLHASGWPADIAVRRTPTADWQQIEQLTAKPQA
jgi:hypothetical protein